MYSDYAINVVNLSKSFQVYEKPIDRLKQFIFPRLATLVHNWDKNYYKEFCAVKNVSFKINKGETVGIIGRNGSGKSTVLQMICGTLSHTFGSVETKGRIAALLELGAGFNPEFSGRENVLLNAAILGVQTEDMKKRMEEVILFSELEKFIDQPVKTYSSGMYARLAFACAIHVEPDVIIIDEALAVGDARFVAKCMRRIKDMQKKGTTILFVSHDVSSVRTLCDRAIWLDQGELIADGDVSQITGKYMEYMFEEEEHEASTTPMDNSEDELCHKTIEIDSRPVTHWGSRKGLIEKASILNSNNERKDIFSYGDKIKISLSLNIPTDISRKDLSIAVSIKDLKGTDLIVSTTRDREKITLPEDEKFSLEFKMTNRLVTEKYLLVVAVERRDGQYIHYYEYLEGAHYFSSVSDDFLFGIFQPEIKVNVGGYSE